MKRHAIIPLGSFEFPRLLVQDGQFASTGQIESERVQCVNLPNASLCADFLLLPSREIVGVCVGVGDNDLALIRSLFATAQPERVILRERSACIPTRYSGYPEWNWLEVIWRDASRTDLVEAQSNQVLWLAKDGVPQRITAMVLEDLDYIESEVEGTFALRLTPNSPPL